MSYENFGNDGGFGIEVFQGDEMQGDEMQGVDLVSGGSDFGASVADLLGYSEFGAMGAPQQQQRPQQRPGWGFGGGGQQQFMQRIDARFSRMEKAILSNAQATKHLIDMARRGVSPPVRVEGRSGITVRDDVPTKPRQLVIGMTTPTIADKATYIITLQPQEIFRVDRLVAAQSIAAGFGITDVKVGKDSQFVAAGEVPSEVFSNVSVGVSLKGDTAKPGIIISVSVVNNSGAGAVFRGAIIGFSVID